MHHHLPSPNSVSSLSLARQNCRPLLTPAPAPHNPRARTTAPGEAVAAALRPPRNPPLPSCAPLAVPRGRTGRGLEDGGTACQGGSEAEGCGAALGAPRPAPALAPSQAQPAPLPQQRSLVSPGAPQRRGREEGEGLSGGRAGGRAAPRLTSTMAPANSHRHRPRPTAMEELPAPAPRRAGSDAPPARRHARARAREGRVS